MPRRIFSFDKPDRLVCGALGQPGKRSFFMQAVKGPTVVSVGLEKAQVAILAERLATLLLALRQGGVPIPDADAALTAPAPSLVEPIVEQFRVGTLTLGWDGEAQKVVIEARELGDEDLEEEADEDEDEEDMELEVEGTDDEPAGLPSLAAELDDPRDVVRVQLEPDAALAFASGALEVVRAGRPPCPLCGAPLEPTGHFCVGRNGHTGELIN
jgi:uncharacterized repeat protein (TIGR03847 family)